MDAIRFDEQKIFAPTKEDLGQVTARRSCGDATTGGCHSEDTLQLESTSAVLMLMLAQVIRMSRFGYSSGETEDVTLLTQSMSTRLEGID